MVSTSQWSSLKCQNQWYQWKCIPYGGQHRIS